MNSTSANDSTIQKAAMNVVTKRPQLELSRVFGIAMFSLLTILFVLEFSRILNSPSKVKHGVPAHGEKFASTLPVDASRNQ